MNDLKIQSKTEEKRVIVYISGDIDAYHSPKSKEEMDTFAVSYTHITLPRSNYA